MKWSAAKCVSDLAPVHTEKASSGTIFAPERPVSDRFLKWSGPSLNTFVGAEIAMEPFIGKSEATITGSRFDPDRTSVV